MAAPASSSSSSSSASRTAVLRLMADLKTIQTETPEGYYASPVSDDDLFEWSTTIFGPYETPWDGGLFEMRLTFPASYPQTPPRVRFVSELKCSTRMFALKVQFAWISFEMHGHLVILSPP